MMSMMMRLMMMTSAVCESLFAFKQCIESTVTALVIGASGFIAVNH